MKVKKIEVKNFKAISEQVADFGGCSAIITAGNNKGKTSFLRGIIDRFHGEKPDIILRSGEEKGKTLMELTDGSKIEWGFTQKTESFKFTTKDGLEIKTGVLKTIGEKYFGHKFDIDKFLNSSPKQQLKEMSSLAGLDFTEIDERYKTAYDKRTDANKELNRLRAISKTEPEKIDKPDIEKLEKEKSSIKKKNELLDKEWKEKNNKHLKEIEEFNEKQRRLKLAYEKAEEDLKSLNKFKSSIFEGCIDFEKAKQEFEKMPLPVKLKKVENLSAVIHYSLDDIEKKIKTANENLRKYDSYEKDLEAYNTWVEEGKEAKKEVEKCESDVKSIELEKKQMIAKAKLPDGFEITEGGLLYKGYPLTDNQVSTSSKYIAALKLGAKVLGEIKTLHFDASALDKNSLNEVEKWAEKNDLQLLIERPDFDGGDISYQILKS